ncbi:MAG: selenocysteine-specific translation elongation factor [Candidatus Sulfotelmatobacter sp.]|jgi:selenocysteine-specific elongation factor
MKSVIVGTAGHIDHGKTALVKALTGIDADRLQEEKRRGITIDLGFAHMDLPASTGEILRVGFVDVPGHERFVRNMLAGAGGIDLVLLVIAADEAIKPQTREHFEILQLLNVRHGITVLTKSDLVDSETLEVVRLEVEDFLHGTFLESSKAPILAVSSLTGAGLADLKRAMVETAARLQPRDSAAIARLPIDRVFTMKGFGTVVTGTLVAGTIHREDELEVLPGARKVRVRGIQVHGEKTESAFAGQRTALNLAGATTDDLVRGMTLVAPAILETTRRMNVSLQLLNSAPRPLKNRARVHFHSHTMETVAEVVLSGSQQIAPGEQTFARLKLSEAALIHPGDRFIIRQFSPLLTIGGGVVLDAATFPRLRAQSDFLKALASDDPRRGMAARIGRRLHQGISISRLVAETGWTRNVIEAYTARMAGDLVRTGEVLLLRSEMEGLELRILDKTSDFHKKNSLAGGINKEELRALVDTSSEVFELATTGLIRDKKIEVVNDLVRLPGRGVVMKDDEAESRKTIEAAFASAGLKVPALQEVLASLKVDLPRGQKIVTLLLRDKVLIKISDQLVFHRTALEELRRLLAAYKAKSASIDVAHFKELTGVSRKYAIPLLEYMDRERVTKRVGDARTLL